MNEYLIIALKTILFLVVIIVIMKIMGKRELGQLNTFDIVVFFMDKNSYFKLLDNITNIKNEQYMKINFNSIFSILNKTLNKLLRERQ